MKKIVKFILVFLCFCSLLSVSNYGCAKRFQLSNYVSQLKSDVFFGESENYSVKAFYGFMESPFNNDGKVGTIKNQLSFTLLGKENDNATYTLSLTHEGKEYKTQFELNPVKNALTSSIEIDEFTQKQFTVKITCTSESEEVLLYSQLPEKTLPYKTVLDSLLSSQKVLINSFIDQQNNFNAEIYVRVMVKEEKPYYYVGFASGNDNLKALLVDGLTCEVLAIREIF